MKFKLLLHAAALLLCSTTLAIASESASTQDGPSTIGSYFGCLQSNYDEVSDQSKDLTTIQEKAIDACQPELRKHLEDVYLADLKRSGDTGTPADPAKSTKTAEEAEIEHARALIKTWHAGK